MEDNMNQLKKLFEPFKIGKLELPNRAVFLAVGTGYAVDGMAGDRQKNFISERARGGVGLSIVGVLSPLKSLPTPTTLGAGDDRYIPRLRDMVEAVHAYEAKIAAQISPSYHFARDASTPAEPAGPSEHIIPVLKQKASITMQQQQRKRYGLNLCQHQRQDHEWQS